MYTMDDLRRETGYSRCHIQRLVSAGYLPRPVGGRRYARYPPEAMTRLLEWRDRIADRVTGEDLVERYGGDPRAYRNRQRPPRRAE